MGVQSKNRLNYTVCYTSIKTTLQAWKNLKRFDEKMDYWF